jgi:hypothetical protein
VNDVAERAQCYDLRQGESLPADEGLPETLYPPVGAAEAPNPSDGPNFTRASSSAGSSTAGGDVPNPDEARSGPGRGPVGGSASSSQDDETPVDAPGPDSQRLQNGSTVRHPIPDDQEPPYPTAPCHVRRGRRFRLPPFVRWIHTACHPPGAPSLISAEYEVSASGEEAEDAISRAPYASRKASSAPCL